MDAKISLFTARHSRLKDVHVQDCHIKYGTVSTITLGRYHVTSSCTPAARLFPTDHVPACYVHYPSTVPCPCDSYVQDSCRVHVSSEQCQFFFSVF